MDKECFTNLSSIVWISWLTWCDSSLSLLPMTWSFSRASALSSPPASGSSSETISCRELTRFCLPCSSSARSCHQGVQNISSAQVTTQTRGQSWWRSWCCSGLGFSDSPSGCSCVPEAWRAAQKGRSCSLCSVCSLHGPAIAVESGPSRGTPTRVQIVSGERWSFMWHRFQYSVNLSIEVLYKCLTDLSPDSVLG